MPFQPIVGVGSAADSDDDNISVACRDEMALLFSRHWISPTQRRVARYLIDHPLDGTFLSSVELAAKVGVSQATVTRLGTAMGYGGFSELQVKLRAIVHRPRSLRSSRHRNKFQAAIHAELRNLDVLDGWLEDSSTLSVLGRELAQSSPLLVVGVRLAAFLANYFSYCAAKIHPDIRLVTSGGSLSFDKISQGRQAGASWVLGFLVPRYPREVVTLLEYARNLGYKVAVVSDRAAEVPNYCYDLLLPVPVARRLVFDSHAAPLVLANLLLEAMSDADPARTLHRLEENERVAAERDVFLHGSA